MAGLYLTFAGNWWAAGWPVVSLVLFVRSGVAVSTLLDPAVRRLQHTIAATPDGPATPEVRRSLSDPRLTRTTWAPATVVPDAGV